MADFYAIITNFGNAPKASATRAALSDRMRKKRFMRASISTASNANIVPIGKY